MKTEYLFLDDVPAHVVFNCVIQGDTESLKLSYDDPDRYDFVDCGGGFINKEYLMWHWPFWVLDTDRPVE